MREEMCGREAEVVRWLVGGCLLVVGRREEKELGVCCWRKRWLCRVLGLLLYFCKSKVGERNDRGGTDLLGSLDLFAGERKEREEEMGGWRLRVERVKRK